jgi:hypothetical protein
MGSQNEESGSYEQTWKHLLERVHILVISTKRYIVFIDHDGDVDWETTKEYDDNAPNEANYNLASYNNALNSAALLEVIPCTGLSRKTKLAFKRLIAEGLGCAFDHDYVTADIMFQRAGEYVRLRGEEVSRSWYLSASSFATLPFVIAALLTVALRSWLQQIITVNGVWLVIASCAGAIGALLSIIARTGKLNFDHAAGRRLHNFEGASRILAGAISGLLAGLAVRSELLFGNLIHENKMNLVMTTIALIAGTSERLVNSIINKVAPDSEKATSTSTNQGKAHDTKSPDHRKP